MRALLLFRGSAGCGKSTFIEEHGLKPYTLCADDIRLMCASPTLQTDGSKGISQANDKIVWNILFRMLETRMQNGEFTVIDATNSKTAEMNKYKDLAKNYRYRIYCIDMTDIPIEEVKRRNANRDVLKRVPDEVIDKMYSRFETQQIPAGIKVLKPDELDTIWYRPMDLSSYKKIHVFGDIHGCIHPISEYLRTEYFGFNYDIPEYWKTERWLNIEDLPNEIWKDIDEYQGLYQISNYGRIKSLEKDKHEGFHIKESIYVLRQGYSGYLYVNLSKQSVKKTFQIHKLVAKYFGLENNEEINHIDGIKQNNNIKNLEYSNRKKNEEHCWKSGLKHGRCVNQFSIDGQLIKTFDSIKEAAEATNCCKTSIIKCCNGEYQSSGGYKWEYVNEINNNRSGKAIKVSQYDLDGNFIKEYDSIKEAEKEVGVQTIRACLAGEIKTAGGYQWDCTDIKYNKNKGNNYIYSSEYLSTLFKNDEFYVFTGDYVDRGIENAEVVNFLCEQCNYLNVVCLEGNHERWLWLWANDIIAKSKEFEFVTKPQLNREKVSKKSVREFYRKLGQCCYFTYYDKTFIITHGGISNVPENLLKIATEQMIKGVGMYSEADFVDHSFTANTNENTYQIHGHRNVANTNIQVTERAYNLEGAVEFGGELRVVQITKDVITPVRVQNTVFKEPTAQAEEINVAENVDMSVYGLVESMRRNRNIYEKPFGRISSFNFTRQAFEKSAWDNIVNKARGLYVDTVDFKVVARAYEKFFNVNERPETQFSNLRYKLQFPVSVYVKENGFLGIVGWNPETEELLITSKSSPTGDFSGYLTKALYSIYGEKVMNKIRDYVKENEVSFVFECCDMINDPHIIEYPESKVVLLDVIKNQIEFEKMPYDELVALANEIGLVVKEKACDIESWEDFFVWYHEVLSEDYKYNDKYIEGFVIEDSVGYMTKLKLHYYKFWKRLRSVAQSVLKYGTYKYTGSLLTPIENEFFGWCKYLFNTLSSEKRDELRDKSYTNICYLRKMFFEWKEEHDKEVQ